MNSVSNNRWRSIAINYGNAGSNGVAGSWRNPGQVVAGAATGRRTHTGIDWPSHWVTQTYTQIRQHWHTLPTHTLITLHTPPPPTHTSDTAHYTHTHSVTYTQLMTLTHTRADWWHTVTLTYHFSDSAALTHCDTLIRWHAYTQVASESIRPLPLTQWHPPWLTTHTHTHTDTTRLTLTMTDGHARVCACTYMQLLNGTITQPHYSFSQRGPARPTPAAATSATPLELTLSGQSVSLVNLSRRPRLKTTVQSVDMLILSV